MSGIGRGRGATMPAWMTAKGNAPLTTTTQTSAPSSTQPVTSAQPETLPPGWFEAFDPTYQHPYYFCPETGERTWTRPPSSTKPQKSIAQNTSSPLTNPTTESTPSLQTSQSSSHGLPPGWECSIDPTTGLAYYYNEETNETQWHPPIQHNTIDTNAPHRSQQSINKNKNNNTHHHQQRDVVIDPMDPSSYSDVPVGGWGVGLGQD